MGKALVLLATFIAFIIAIYLWFTGQHDAGLFVGIWVPSILALAIYMKK